MVEESAGALIAFGAAMIVVYIDGYQAIRKKLFRVPWQFWQSTYFGLFAAACGLIAATAYVYAAQPQNSGWLDTLLGSKIESPYLRAIYTGLAVLAIIRSKLLQVRGADIGVEYAYSEFRIKCLGSVQAIWIERRDKFVRENLEKPFEIPDFTDDVKALIEAAVEYADADYRTSVRSQLAETIKSTPSTPPSPGNSEWRVFYRALIGLALENCGPKPLERMGFKPF